MSDEISGKHIGMRNVHRRIQLHFGEAYGLKIDSEWQKGTTVTILLPVEEVDQAKEVTEDENRNCQMMNRRSGMVYQNYCHPDLDLRLQVYLKMPWKRWNSCLFLMRM